MLVAEMLHVPLENQLPADLASPGAPARMPEALQPQRIAAVNLYVVIPMYNEAKRLGTTMEVLARSSLNRPDVQFLFSDDGSTDHSDEIALETSAHVGFVRPLEVSVDRTNRGKGAAVRRGVLAAVDRGAPYIAFLDADLSLDPSVLDEALATFARTSADVVVGERIVESSQQPKLRRLISLSFRYLTSRLAPTGVSDTQCACKVFTSAAAEICFEPLGTPGFAFDVEVLVRAHQSSLRVVEFPVAWQHTPGSRVNPITDSIKMAIDVLRIRRSIRS